MKLFENEGNKNTLLITVISAAAVEILFSLGNDIIIPIIDGQVDNKDGSNDLKSVRDYQIKFLGGYINAGNFFLNFVKFTFIVVVMFIIAKKL